MQRVVSVHNRIYARSIEDYADSLIRQYEEGTLFNEDGEEEHEELFN